MFGKIIPMNVLAQMPLPFVHRLRDIRIKQIEEANKMQERQLRQAQIHQRQTAARYNQSVPPNTPPPQYQTNNMHWGGGVDPAMFNGTPYDDFIDELTF